MGCKCLCFCKDLGSMDVANGHRACLGPEVICYNQDWVVLEGDAIVSQYSYLCTAGHDVDHANMADCGLITAPIVLRRGAWVGSRCIHWYGSRNRRGGCGRCFGFCI